MTSGNSLSFNIGEKEFDGSTADLYGMSRRLTPYLVSQEINNSVRKPRSKTTKLWRDILQWVEQWKVQRWVEIGYFLMNVHFEGQKLFEREFCSVKENVKDPDFQRLGKHNVKYVISGPPQRQSLLVAFAYKDLSLWKADQAVNQLATQSMNEFSIRSVLLVGADASGVNYPCSIVKLYC